MAQVFTSFLQGGGGFLNLQKVSVFPVVKISDNSAHRFGVLDGASQTKVRCIHWLHCTWVWEWPPNEGPPKNADGQNCVYMYILFRIGGIKNNVLYALTTTRSGN